jgi:hypothetical protein
MALLVLVPSAIVLLKKDSKGSWLVLPLLVLLLVAVALPSNLPPGFRAVMAGRAEQRRMEGAGESLKSWSSERRQLPADDQELGSAIAVETQALIDGGSEKNSRFGRGDQPVPYRFVLVAGAQSPHRAQPAGDQPAIVYCAISPDRQKFWLTATALPGDVSSEVVMLGRDGELVVINGEVPAKSPEPAPTAEPEKKSKKGAPTAK